MSVPIHEIRNICSTAAAMVVFALVASLVAAQAGQPSEYWSLAFFSWLLATLGIAWGTGSVLVARSTDIRFVRDTITYMAGGLVAGLFLVPLLTGWYGGYALACTAAFVAGALLSAFIIVAVHGRNYWVDPRASLREEARRMFEDV